MITQEEFLKNLDLFERSVKPVMMEDTDIILEHENLTNYTWDVFVNFLNKQFLTLENCESRAYAMVGMVIAKYLKKPETLELLEKLNYFIPKAIIEESTNSNEKPADPVIDDKTVDEIGELISEIDSAILNLRDENIENGEEVYEAVLSIAWKSKINLVGTAKMFCNLMENIGDNKNLVEDEESQANVFEGYAIYNFINIYLPYLVMFIATNFNIDLFDREEFKEFEE